MTHDLLESNRKPIHSPEKALAEAEKTAFQKLAFGTRAILSGTYRSKGVKKAGARYRELRQNASDKYDFGVLQLNSMGYELLRNGDTKGAVEIFRLNIEQFPTDANVDASLGEAYLKQGDKALAVENYEKSLDLNPQNENARGVLKKLEVSNQ